MGIIDHRLDPRLKISAPIIRRKEQALLISYTPPYHKAVQQIPCSIDLGLGTIQIELSNTINRLTHTLWIQANPHHVVFRADEPSQALIAFDHAAEDRKIRMERNDRFCPCRRVPLKTVSHTGDLIVAGLIITSPAKGCIKLE